MVNNGKSGSSMGRRLSFSLLRPEQWNRHKHLRGGLILAMTICSIVAAVGWYEIAKGVDVSILRLVLVTSAALVILIAVPKKWELITLTFGLTFILSILGTVLRRTSLRFGLEIVFVTGVLYFGCVYIGERLKEHKGG
jgi:hypothetical protein